MTKIKNMQLINLIFESFWHFIGACILLSILGNFILNLWNRFWRHLNIRKHGYPPNWCDADGDFKKASNDDTV